MDAFTTDGPPDTGSFIRFPDRDAILEKLRTIESYGLDLEPLLQKVAGRLASKAYDRSAFVFILIEMIYELEEATGVDLTSLLSQVVLALTHDADLAGSAIDTFEEVKETIESPTPEPAAMSEKDSSVSTKEIPIPSRRAAIPDDLDQGQLMHELQGAQKRVTDLGLSTRMSIELALSRPHRQGIGTTLREISSLRTTLRRFEELLLEAEEQILEAIGVLERDRK